MKINSGLAEIQVNKEQVTKEIKDLGSTLLEVGSSLMSSGANTGRIRTTVNRISDAFGYTTELLITHRALMLTISNEENSYYFDILKRTAPHGVNFRVVSGISRMSWRVVEEKWSIEQINEELDRLVALPHFPRIVILLAVSLAGSSFCRLAGGGWEDMVIVYIASFLGLFVRQEAVKKKFNPYLCVFFASLTAAMFAGFVSFKLGYGDKLHHGFITSVLFLIPGVPFINTYSDLIDGNTQNGIVRGINGAVIAFAIALGLLTAMFVYQV
jgi:uncharacterized membrane protein YjjP (DUF1212 family)